MKRLTVLLGVCLLVLSFFAGCHAASTPATEPSDPNVLYEETLTEEVKTKIKNKVVLKYDTVVSWHLYDTAHEYPSYNYPYYGTVNGCVIVRQSLAGMNDAPGRTLLEVADYTFEWCEAFDFYVYRDGEVFTLQEAYESNWLTKEQVGAIHEKHSGFYALWLEDHPQYNTTFDVRAYIAGYKNDIRSSLYQLDGARYERFMSSAVSADDAVSICTDYFTSDNQFNAETRYTNKVTECYVIYESELLYGVYVKWEYFINGNFVAEYDENVISFKKAVFDATVESGDNGIEKTYHICTDQEEQMEQLALYVFFEESHFNRILYYEKSGDDESFTLTLHSYQVSGGDWGVCSEYRFYQQQLTVDKATGAITITEPELLQSVYDYYQ